MNVIFVGRKRGRVKQFDLRIPWLAAAAPLVFASWAGPSPRDGPGRAPSWPIPIDQLGNWSADLLREQAQIDDVARMLQEKVNALAMRVGQMNANVIRLDALGKRLTRMANLDDGEFDFGQPPAFGGARRRRRPAGADPEPHGHGR